MSAEAFDFDREVDRSNTHSAKWEKYAGQDVLPFWVADMDFAAPASRAVSEGESERAILCCGSAAGMAIVANKFSGVRAVACHNEWTARMSREHNDANVLALGGRVIDAEEAKRLARLWLDTPFEGGRHRRRISKISELERSPESAL